MTRPCRITGAAIALMPGAYISAIMLKPRLRSSSSTFISALNVVGALGPYSRGEPKPWRATSSVARSSDRVMSQACPPALQDRRTSMPMSGS